MSLLIDNFTQNQAPKLFKWPSVQNESIGHS